jgi:hypothetical protein
VVKTYQSDIFNNWIQTDWITGENGIAAITAIDTTGDSFTLDALNLAQKVYNMLNRIAISGGTYEDWQEAVYSEKAMRRAETPIYCGGYSSEIVFEEVVSTAESENQPLGTLAGRGAEQNAQGGNIVIRCDEPCLIMGIASITPRLDYTQGNKWFTEQLKTIYQGKTVPLFIKKSNEKYGNNRKYRRSISQRNILLNTKCREYPNGKRNASIELYVRRSAS